MKFRTHSANGPRPLLWLACTALLSAPLARAQSAAIDSVSPGGIQMRMVNSKPVVGVDGVGIVEIGDTLSGPWTPFREAMPGMKLEAELPLTAGRRFIRIRRPDGRVEEAVSILKALPSTPPRFTEMTSTGFDGDSALITATLAPGQPDTQQVIPFFLNDKLIIFRDDGTAGDRVAGDGQFTGEAPVERDEVQRAITFLNGLPPGEPVVRGSVPRGAPLTSNVIPVSEAREILEGFAAGKPTRLPLPLGFSPTGLVPIDLPAPPDDRIRPITPCNQLPTWQKTLLITNVGVVEDPKRTFDPCTGRGTPMGPWTFGKLMTDMANTPVSGVSASDFARRWLRSWMFDQSINHDAVPKRTAMMAEILSKWETASGGAGRPLDMAKAPFRLLAIVNRLDLRGNVTYNGGITDPCDPPCNGGEGRFVFCFCDGEIDRDPGGYGNGGDIIIKPPVGVPAAGPGKEFIVIMEFCVPKNDCRSLLNYAQEWANLQCLPFGETYNAALQTITTQFAGLNAAPGRPNNSAINQVRTNENLLDPQGLWELREFKIFKSDSDAGHLRPVTVKQTPRGDVDGTVSLQNYITTTAPVPPAHLVPLEWPSTPGGANAPFLGGRAIMAPISLTSGSASWAVTGATAPNMVRHHFALNTCNGCHSTETGARFTHIGCRLPGQPAPLSEFLTGDGSGGAHVVTLPGAPAGTASFFDLRRREQDLVQFLLNPCGLSILGNGRALDTAAVH